MITDKNKAVIIPFLLITGALAGFFLHSLFGRTTHESAPSRSAAELSQTREVRAGGYEFINPLLECDHFKPIRDAALVTLEAEILAYIEQALGTKKAQHISVYFRDLNNGPWIGINEDEKYSPASLLKVPVAIAAMKRAEAEPSFLSKMIKYESARSGEAAPNMNDTVYIKKGRKYTVEQLIEYMVAASDNEAMMLVLNSTGDSLTAKVMSDLGIKKSGGAGKNDFVSVREYSSMFRLLFNATYLDKDKSNKLLEMMSRSKYNQGLVAGLPAGMKTSHKFGERAFNNSDTRQLHDCGIVYLPARPYLLCVMTRGNDFNELAAVISDISAIVYSKISKIKA